MWLQTVLGTACLLAVTQATVIISDDVVGDGDGNFNFEVLGSLCFAPNTLASVKVQTNAIGSGVVPTGSLVVYTQNSLHSLFNSGSNCADQSDLAECVDIGLGDCSKTVPLGTVVDVSYQVPSTTTELFFVVWDCDATDRIDLDFVITSDQAEGCSAVREDPNATGYAVAVVFLCVVNLGLVVLTMIFWKRKEQLASIEI